MALYTLLLLAGMMAWSALMANSGWLRSSDQANTLHSLWLGTMALAWACSGPPAVCVAARTVRKPPPPSARASAAGTAVREIDFIGLLSMSTSGGGRHRRLGRGG